MVLNIHYRFEIQIVPPKTGRYTPAVSDEGPRFRGISHGKDEGTSSFIPFSST